MLTVATCASLVAIGVWLVSPGSTHDDCALPAGTATLAPAAQAEIARHLMACRDLEHGRISRDDYRMMIGATVPPTPPVETIQWASSVRAVSSEYTTTSWSAQQVLGPPNVYPASGDNANAWASLEADGRSEFIEVGFAQPTSMRELQIFETYNPGAIASVETIDVLGRHVTLIPCGGTFTTGACHATQLRPAATAAQITKVPLACGAPITAVRVTLASAAVPGWNEIDAIGGVPCAME
jgi:hypothetical protein